MQFRPGKVIPRPLPPLEMPPLNRLPAFSRLRAWSRRGGLCPGAGAVAVHYWLPDSHLSVGCEGRRHPADLCATAAHSSARHTVGPQLSEQVGGRQALGFPALVARSTFPGALCPADTWDRPPPRSWDLVGRG